MAYIHVIAAEHLGWVLYAISFLVSVLPEELRGVLQPLFVNS